MIVEQSIDTEDSTQTVPITLATYRDLRIGLAVTQIMLAVSIVTEAFRTKCVQGALSEYFFTSSHSIFIATLLGMATLFFVYRGSSDTEDALLSLAGVAALVAALVPQGQPQLCTPTFVPDTMDFESVARPNLAAVAVALTLGWGLTWLQHRFNRTRQLRSVGGTLTLYFLRTVVGIAIVGAVFFPTEFKIWAQGAAGVLMLLAFITTVWASAFLGWREQTGSKYWIAYLTIGCVMIGALAVVVYVHVMHPDWLGALWVTVLESSLILLFGLYWIIQTRDLWNTPDRAERLCEADQHLLKQRRETLDPRTLPGDFLQALKARWGERLLRMM